MKIRLINFPHSSDYSYKNFKSCIKHNRIKFFLYILMATVVMASCKKDEIPFYTGDDGISFYVAQNGNDSLSYSFAFSIEPKIKDTLFLNMRVVGGAKDFARTVQIDAAEGTTARKGVDFELPEVQLPAGALFVQYPLILFNTPEMTTNTFRIVAEIANGKDFIPGATGLTIDGSYSINKLKIDVSNRLIQPSYWPGVAGAFGAFSATKFRFMIQTTGRTDFSVEAIGTDGYYNLPVKLRNALIVYEAANGPLIDEFGNRVTF